MDGRNEGRDRRKDVTDGGNGIFCMKDGWKEGRGRRKEVADGRNNILHMKD
jgi:hypothetical protein